MEAKGSSSERLRLTNTVSSSQCGEVDNEASEIFGLANATSGLPLQKSVCDPC